MKYYFPIHLDGGNRGCEAIAKGSALLLNQNANNILAYCRDKRLDTQLGVDKYMTLVEYNKGSYVTDKFLALLYKIFKNKVTEKWRLLYPYRPFLKLIGKEDIMISTGGDMMCYKDNEVIYTNNELHEKGIKTILWGCSMGKENLTPMKKDTLFKFSLIYARESLSYEFFKSLGLENVCLCPDPAFILEPEVCELPKYLYNGDVIGINISNYTAGGMNLNGRFGNEIKKTISFILENTKFNILLIPHVTWNFGKENQDDREMAKIIRHQFYETERIHILNIDNMNYCQIRYAISKCRFFIGSRTHSVISAYSVCVPTIALGYSIKSRGIAKDLRLDRRLVVNSKDFTEGELLSSFKYMIANENSIRNTLTSRMPEYKKEAYKIREHIKQIYKR